MNNHHKLYCFLFISLILSCSKKDVPEPEPEQFSFIEQVDLTGRTMDLWGITRGDNEYVIVTGMPDVSSDGWTYIIDITNPSDPAIKSVIEYGGMDVKVWGNYVYVANGNNVISAYESKIFDISDISAPKLVGSFPSYHNIFIDGGNLFTNGYYGNLTTADSIGQDIAIFDINETPENPKLIWAKDSGRLVGPVHDIAVIRNKLYSFDISAAKIEIYDLADRTVPQLLGQYQFQGDYNVHSGWVTEDDGFLFVCMEQSEPGDIDIVILDISDPASIIEVGSIHDPAHIAHNLYIIDNYAYTSFYSAGLRIYDISNPANPELVYDYDTNGDVPGAGAFGVYPFFPSGVICVSDVDNGLFIFKKNF